MDANLMQEQLNSIIDMKKSNPNLYMEGEVYDICHMLADSQHQQALKFFKKGLNDPKWHWRQRCLQMIGFHYEVSPVGEITGKIRKMATSDRNAFVRMTAVDVLGEVSTLPDQTLLRALSSDSDWFVRRSAYCALLKLAGVSYNVYVREHERFDFETLQPEPTLQDLKLVLAEEGIEIALGH